MARGEKTGGRGKGTPNKATAEVRDLAADYGPAALAELARLSTMADSEAARVSACNSILERAYGRSVAGRPIVLNLPDASTIEGVTQAFADIIAAAAKGDITPGEANEFGAILERQRQVLQVSNVERRLAAIEEALNQPGMRIRR